MGLIKLGKLLIQVAIVVAVAREFAFAQALQEIRIGSSAIGFISLGRTAEEWATVCPRDGNMFSSGMGNHIPIALGLAKVLPHRQVILLDTDGSVLMLLLALTTLGAYPAPNLKIFVFDNEAYEGTGGPAHRHVENHRYCRRGPGGGRAWSGDRAGHGFVQGGGR